MSAKPDSPVATRYAASPNHDARESRIDILLLHYTGMETAEAALERLRDREARVSCHYFVDEDGRVTQMVAEAQRAWHGGAGSCKGATDINSRSIGIEIVNPGHEFGYRDFPDAQIEAVIKLCRYIIKRRHIPRERVLAHSDVAPARKKDPGEKFPWVKFAAAGVGFWVEPAPIAEGRTLSASDDGAPVEDLQKQLIKFGYGLEVTRLYDDATRLVVTAFQRHFRPERVDGLADPSTMETLRNLLKTLHAHH